MASKTRGMHWTFPFSSWTHELGIPFISKSMASSSFSWQVQTTTMCISVSLSGSVVLGCLFAPKVHIILFQPQKNVASLRVTASRFSATVSASASAPSSSYSKGTSFLHSQCVAAIHNYLVIVFSRRKKPLKELNLRTGQFSSSFPEALRILTTNRIIMKILGEITLKCIFFTVKMRVMVTHCALACVRIRTCSVFITFRDWFSVFASGFANQNSFCPLRISF